MRASGGDIPVQQDRLFAFVCAALQARGAAGDQAVEVARALVGASLRGVDSHGVRLLPHYLRALAGGRIAGQPVIRILQTGPSAAVVDADNGFGHAAGYRAIAEACVLARQTGIAAVSVINSSHFGAAGSYALAAAEEGLLGLAFCNSDSFALPHDGLVSFHGTNPIAFAAPVKGDNPFLLDMATTIVPGNRIMDYLLKGLPAPEDVGVDAEGRMTTDPAAIAALLSLGGARFGFKGAGLAAMIEVLSAPLTGMAHSGALLTMMGADMSTPRRLGHFFIAIDPGAFVARPVFEAGMSAYLTALRATPARPGTKVMAPGDREWAVAAERGARGIPVAPALMADFETIAADLGLETGLLAPG